MQVEKTVFISYRRTNVFTARAVYQYLTTHGYDAFLDFASIDAGSFEQVILNQIAARAHFIIVLTPNALERCVEPGDWLRREIEHAIDLKRNIVPLMFEGFDFDDMVQYLTGKMTMLKEYNGLPVYAAYFEEAMIRLHTRYLSKPLEMILHPTPTADKVIVEQQQAAAAQETAVTEGQLTAEEWLERGLTLGDNSDEEFNCYTMAIELNPQYAIAYYNRGTVRYKRGDLDGAVQDFDEAIRLDPQHPGSFNNRGFARSDSGDLDGAIADYDEAIRLDPQDANTYRNRGNVRSDSGDLDGAIADYDEAIRLDPQDATTYCNRGNLRYDKGDLDAAIADYNEAIRLDPQDADAYNNRGVARSGNGDLDGAFADYDEAIRLDPQDATTYRNRGDAHKAKGDLDGAIADFEMALRINPNYQRAKENLEIAQQQKRERR